MKSESLHQPKQSMYRSENIFQGKYDIHFVDTQHMKNVITEQHKGEEQYLSLSPTPKKYARLEGDTNNCGKHSKKGRNRSRKAECCEFKLDTDDEMVLIKSETVDDLEKVQIKEELTSLENDVSNARISSPHSSTRHFLSKNGMSSVEASTTVSSPAFPGHGESSLPSLKPECTSVSPGAFDDAIHDQPDSSTGMCENFTREHEDRKTVCSNTSPDASFSTTTPTTKGETTLCQVCGDIAAGFYCGAFICEACKKFFIRASKLDTPRYVCLRSKQCVITKESRIHCQYCRYQKCLQLSMYYPKDGQKNVNKMGVQEIPCRVCSAPSSGFHFGALTCEGCKGFFRRMVKEREAYSYKCSRSGNCEVNAMTRNMCKACRYNKCMQIGMSMEGSRIGRQPNSVKHALSIEAKKQAALKVEPVDDNGVNTNSSHISFDSVIFDPCNPGEVDVSLHTLDVSSSGDVLESPERKLKETKSELQSPIPFSQENEVLDEAEKHILSSSFEHQSDFCRQDLSPSSLDYYKFVQNPYSSSLNSSSMSVDRHLQPQVFERPHNEAFDLSADNQPQDLSIDLSISRTSTAVSGHTTSQTKMSTLSTPHLSSPSNRQPYSIPHPTPINLSSPSPNSPPSAHFYPTEYPHQVQQHFQYPYFINSFVNRDKHCWSVHHHPEKYDESTSVYKIESHNPSHNNPHKSRQTPQQEMFISTLYTQNAQPQLLGSVSTSSFPDCNRSSNTFQEQNQASHFYQLGSEPLLQPQPIYSKQKNMDEIYTCSTDPSVYISHLERDVYKCSPDLHSYHGTTCPSPEPYNLKLSQQQRSPSQPSTSQTSHYVSPHLSSPSPALTTAPYPCQEPKIFQTSLHSTDIQKPLSPAPIQGKDSAALSQNCLNMSNEELHSVVLDAARNLANFCAVSRAKSDLFDADRFKDVDSTWEKMMEHFNFHATSIVRFAKRVPGFRSLKIDDQVLLLRMATYSLVILNHSRAYEPDTGFYNYFNFTQKEIQIIRKLFPEFDVIHNHYKHSGIMAQRHELTEMEYAYMSCLLLLNDEYQSLENAERTKELKAKFLEAFQDYEIEHFPKGNLRFGEMLLHLSEFSQFNVQHSIAVGLVITKNPQLHIPQLYAEMYTQNSSMPDSNDSLNDETMPINSVMPPEVTNKL